MGKDNSSSGSNLLFYLMWGLAAWGLRKYSTEVSCQASVKHVNGPDNPPGGSGSVRIATGPFGSAKIWLKSSPAIRLADLTALCYNTYIQNYGQGGFLSAPLTLLINFETDTTIDDELYFMPDYQDDAYPVPNQGEVALNTWQDWNALVGCWISVTEGKIMTLAEYIQLHPNAKIINADGHGGILFDLFWQSWIGHIGYLSIGIAGENRVIQF